MRSLKRRTAWRIAAVLSVLVALVGIVAYDVPTLAGGAADSADPYWLVLGSFASDVLALVAAYGAWRGQKWGAVLLIVVNAYWLMQALSGLLFENQASTLVFASVMFVHHIVVITLCLWRERARVAV